MAVISRSVTVPVGSTPTAITGLDNDDAYGYTMLLQNTDTQGNHLLYIGGSDVTIANGYPIQAGTIVGPMSIKRSETLYVVHGHTTSLELRALILNG